MSSNTRDNKPHAFNIEAKQRMYGHANPSLEETQGILARANDEERGHMPGRKHTGSRKKKLLIAATSIIGILLVVIIVGAVLAGTLKDDHIKKLTDMCGSTDASLCTVLNPTPDLQYDYRRRPRAAYGSRMAVAADNSRCADEGLQVMKEGGNAIDSAIATILCQGIINPFASGIGGGHFMVIVRSDGRKEVINAREIAPKAAHAHMYDGMPANASTDGGLAVAVPMELKGLELAFKRHGSGNVTWGRLLQPAIFLAEKGFPTHPYLVHAIEDSLTKLRSSPLTRSAFLIPSIGGTWRAPNVGEWCCKRPTLANTLRRVASEGADWLYMGSGAEGLVKDLRDVGGVMVEEDLAEAQAMVVEPIVQSVGPYQLVIPPPPSSSAILPLALNILYGIPGFVSRTDTQSASAQLLNKHRMIEAMKHAFAVRLALGDPGAESKPQANISHVLSRISDPDYIARMRSSINDTYVRNVTVYGGELNPLRQQQNSGAVPDDHGTTHVGVVDGEGNAVSVTSTINTAFGSGVISPSTGILLNNEMDDFSRTDMPNAWGLHPSEANFIAPGKRPLSSMSPTIILSDGGRVRMVIGANGGPKIITAVFETIVRTLFWGVDLLTAINTPRLHHQLMPQTLFYENYTYEPATFDILADPSVVGYLVSKGNTARPQSGYIGNCQAILVNTTTSSCQAVSDPRKDGAPAAL